MARIPLEKLRAARNRLDRVQSELSAVFDDLEKTTARFSRVLADAEVILVRAERAHGATPKNIGVQLTREQATALIWFFEQSQFKAPRRKDKRRRFFNSAKMITDDARRRLAKDAIGAVNIWLGGDDVKPSFPERARARARRKLAANRVR